MPYGRDPARDSYRRLRAAAHEDEGGMDMTHVLLEKKEHIAVATINRPKALNALNSEGRRFVSCESSRLKSTSLVCCM